MSLDEEANGVVEDEASGRSMVGKLRPNMLSSRYDMLYTGERESEHLERSCTEIRSATIGKYRHLHLSPACPALCRRRR